MSVILRHEKSQAFPAQYLWTREKYEQATRLGLFSPEDRVELIEGEIVTTMTQNSPHATAVRLMDRALNRCFSAGFDVRGQMPLSLGRYSQPEPDLAVVTGSPRDYRDRHPSAEETVLIVEISDSTLTTDRIVKASLYARAGVPDFWIVNLPDRILEVYRAPAADPEARYGFSYGETRHVMREEGIAPLAAPDAPMAVADLLP